MRNTIPWEEFEMKIFFIQYIINSASHFLSSIRNRIAGLSHNHYHVVEKRMNRMCT